VIRDANRRTHQFSSDTSATTIIDSFVRMTKQILLSNPTAAGAPQHNAGQGGRQGQEEAAKSPRALSWQLLELRGRPLPPATERPPRAGRRRKPRVPRVAAALRWKARSCIVSSALRSDRTVDRHAPPTGALGDCVDYGWGRAAEGASTSRGTQDEAPGTPHRLS
jgi:hypothetical protein